MARISLRSPSSWATEINLQSRYPEGISVTKIGAACWAVAFRGARAVKATTPAKVATAVNKSVSRFIVMPPTPGLALAGRRGRQRLSALALGGAGQVWPSSAAHRSQSASQPIRHQYQ